MKRRDILKGGAAVGGLALASGAGLAPAFAAQAAPGVDSLYQGFVVPPADARPRVWWHWVNGNVSREGVMADLAWMKRVGIGGFTLFDAAFRSPPTPVVVERPLIFHSPEWREVVAATAAEAARLGLDFGVHIAGGWSESGGPWVQPQQAMKKLVWSEVEVQGGRPLSQPLPHPPEASGPYQDYPIAANHAEPRLYRDVAVVAFPAPETPRAPQVQARTNAGPIDMAALSSGHYAEAQTFTMAEGQPLVIELDYAAPWPVSSLTVSGSPGVPDGKVEASEDGVVFREVLNLPGAAEKGAPVRTYSLAPIRARRLRITLDRPASGRIELRQLAVRSEARIHRFEDKAGLGTLADYDAVATPEVVAGQAVATSAVIDLTGRMSADGRLDWTPPPGRWIVQRFGYALTGKRNGPATDAATGLEADKMNADHVRAHMEGFFGPLMEAVGENHGERGLRHAIVDSWEAGQQNWTEAMAEEFRARRGYDLTPFLPALTGRVVESADASDRLLWDFRATIGDLLADNHYAVVRDFVHARGLYLYGESMGVDLPTVGDGLRLKGLSDIPTGEFWAQVDNAPPWPTHLADIREAASAAHIYGRTMVAAEAFTALDEIPAWSMGPRELKPVADRFLAEGVNRFVIHTSVHQPFLDRAPGVTLRRFGQHFTRHESWAEQAGSWMDYLARGSYLQQQGRRIADLAIFYGDGAPAAAPFRPGLIPEIPNGHDYDYVNAEVLASARGVDGDLVLASGARYRVLSLTPGVRWITPQTLSHFERLAGEGVTLAGVRPLGLAGRDAGADVEARLRRLWPDGANDAGEALRRQGVGPDVEDGGVGLFWSHRRTDDADIYFLACPPDGREAGEVRFRVSGREPQVWSALDGARVQPGWRHDGQHTSVALDLQPGEAVFVVFRSAGVSQAGLLSRVQDRVQVASADGPWRVTFQSGRGVGRSVSLDRLGAWTDQSNPAVRYFSGVATYATRLRAPRPGAGRLVLDLGEVAEVAAVRVNGRSVGGVWTAPYRIDVTEALRAGDNQIEIDVANYWHNRLVGDLQPGAEKVGFVTVDYYRPDTPLQRSGLIGPVTLWRHQSPRRGGAF